MANPSKKAKTSTPRVTRQSSKRSHDQASDSSTESSSSCLSVPTPSYNGSKSNTLKPVKSSVSVASSKPSSLRSSKSFSSFFNKNKGDNGSGEQSSSRNSSTTSLHGTKRKRRTLFGFINSNADSGTSEDEDNDIDNNSENDLESLDDRSNSHRSKRRRNNRDISTLKQEEEEKARLAFEAKEKEYDAELPEEYRKFRPRGYRFKVPPKDRPVRIYADGVFDLFHLGHMRQLEQSKKALPNATLVCGVPSDEETHKKKGLTVLNDSQRCDTLKHCRWVDEVIPNAPWCVTPEFLKEHNIDYVAHDDLPYASAGSDDIYAPIKAEGMFLTTQRTDGISTSDIITKIIRDYDKYLMRNFARGASRKELNVSWLKKNELDLKRHVQELRESFKSKYADPSKDLISEVRAYITNVLGKNNNEKHRSKGLTPRSSVSTAGGSETSGSLGDVPELEIELGSEPDNLDDTDKERESIIGRSRSPVTDFVDEYAGSSTNTTFHPPSVVGTFKGWLSRKSSASSSPQVGPVSGRSKEPENLNLD